MVRYLGAPVCATRYASSRSVSIVGRPFDAELLHACIETGNDGELATQSARPASHHLIPAITQMLAD